MHFLRLACLSAAALPLSLSLAGCADYAAHYPSLAPRPIENISLVETRRPTPPPASANADAVARYMPLIQEARDADTSFHRTLDEERSTLALGKDSPTGSDAWVAAQTSLSRIEATRAPITRILSDLDAARNADPSHASSGEAIAAAEAFEQVHQIDTAESAAITSLWPTTP